METIYKLNEFLTKTSDPRTKDWPLMGFTFISFITLSYTLFIYYLGPSLMKSRPAFELKYPMVAFNVFQFLAHASIIYIAVTSEWMAKYHLGCMPMNLEFTKDNLQMANIFWWNLIIKITRLGDTIFYVLRKRESHVSTSHVYHHMTTAIMAWVVARFYPGPMLIFGIFGNYFICSSFYGYYLMNYFGALQPQNLRRLKKIIVTTSVVEVAVTLVRILNTVQTCEVPKELFYLIALWVAVMLFLIFDSKYNTQPRQPKTIKLKRRF